MLPEVPEYSLKNQNNLIAGAYPVYYFDDNSQEQQSGPMAASIDWAAISASIEGNIVHMIPSTESTYSVYAITDTTHVYGITTSGATDLGYPSGSSVSNTGGRLAIAGGILFAVYTSQIYKNTLPATIGGWTTAGSGISNPGGVHFMEPFLDFLAYADATSGGNPYQLIKKMNVSSFAQTSGIDFGVGFGITGMTNYNNKYLAVTVGKTSTGGAFGFPQNYLFLWNGISTLQGSGIYSTRIPGQFIDMKVIDSVLYVAVKGSKGRTALYTLGGSGSGIYLKKVLTSQYSTIFTNAGISVNTVAALFDFKNYVGLHLDSTSDLSNPLLVFGQEGVGRFKFIHSYGRLFFQIVTGYDGNIFSSQYVISGNSNLFYLPSSGTYQQIFYKSQWIPVSKASAIDIDYETPPASGSDAINVKIYGRGEDIIAPISVVDGISCQSATALDAISTTTILNQRRTRLDLKGFVGDEVLIRITTVNSAWNPIIKGIYIITQ